MRNTGFQALACTSCQRTAGSKATAAQAWQPCVPFPKRALCFSFPLAQAQSTMLSVPCLWGCLTYPCLKHWSNMGAVQQLGSRFLGEAVTHLPSRHPSVPSLSCPRHADTSTHVFNAQSQKNVLKFVCIPHGLTWMQSQKLQLERRSPVQPHPQSRTITRHQIRSAIAFSSLSLKIFKNGRPTSVSGLHYSPGEEVSPDVQPEPPMPQFVAIAPCDNIWQYWEEFCTIFVATLQLVTS